MLTQRDMDQRWIRIKVKQIENINKTKKAT